LTSVRKLPVYAATKLAAYIFLLERISMCKS